MSSWKRRLIIPIAVCLILLSTGYGIAHYRHYLANMSDTQLAVDFLMETVAQEKPLQKWSNQLPPELRNNAEQIFYFFKIWFVESGTSPFDIRTAYPVSAYNDLHSGRLFLDIRYKSGEPPIRCTISNDNRIHTISPSFPMNNCLYHPDYNSDGYINALDLAIARNRMAQQGAEK